MADITEIRELAQSSTFGISQGGYIDLNDEKLSNLDYLKMVLEKNWRLGSDKNTPS